MCSANVSGVLWVTAAVSLSEVVKGWVAGSGEMT